ncbi:MAG: VOC family protein [Myxococcales bacterium]|nr:VOC family protein [Myxococcales bacterium]
MIDKVAFTMYPARDAARARAFYEGVLGLEPGQQGLHGSMFWLEYDLPGGGCIALSNAGPSEPSTTAGGTIALEVTDLDGLIAHLKAHDVPFLGELVHGPNCRMQVVRDPEGNSLLLHQLNR